MVGYFQNVGIPKACYMHSAFNFGKEGYTPKANIVTTACDIF